MRAFYPAGFDKMYEEYADSYVLRDDKLLIEVM